MQPTVLLAVIIRIVAVLIVVVTLRHGVYSMLLLASEHAGLSDAVIVVFTVSLPLAIAVLLWTFPLRIAGRLLPRATPPGPAPNWHGSEVQAVAFVLMGFWLVIGTMVDMSYWISYFLLWSSHSSQSPMTPEVVGSLVSTAVQLAIGLALILGGRGLSRVQYLFRYGATPMPTQVSVERNPDARGVSHAADAGEDARKP